jgi:hypothetical protein
MRPNENIKKLITELKVNPSAELDARVNSSIDNVLAQRKRIESAYGPTIWRIIMRSPITKLAMAAVVIIAAGLAIHYFAGEGAQKCCAWTKIADKVAQFKTCVCNLHLHQTGTNIGPQGQDAESKLYISSDYGYKLITSHDGIVSQQMYINTNDKVMYIVMPSEKKYMRIGLTDEMLEKTKGQMQDPRTIVTKCVSGITGQYKDLGKDVINGVEVHGIEVNNPPGIQGLYNNFVGRLWVDVATEYPVRMEIEGEIAAGVQKISQKIVMDGFEWGTELSEDVFKPDIPADYTKLADMKMPGQDESGAIEGFKLFSQVTKGKYPSTMNVLTTTQEAQQGLVAEMNLMPGTQPSDAMQQELVNKALKLQGPFMFYTKLTQEGKEPVYRGDKVTAEFGDAILMRWKVSDNQYRVILGNLTVKNVTADELAALEAMPLNRNPKAIKPEPADGSICGKIADMELNWMPGIYAAKQKIYMGTAADKLDELADVTDDSNLLVAELKRNMTYYWRVDAIDANGKVTAGDIWSFNTGKLAGWWKFDESTGTTAIDSSGNGNSGILKGNPVWRPAGGVSGGAIELDGKGDYVEISNESAFDITGQITVSAWVNITDVPQEWTGIVTKGDSAWRVSTSFANNIFHFGVSARDFLNGKSSVDSGQWHNVTCVYDGQNMNIYVDGKLDASRPRTGPLATNNFPVCIGENIELKGRCLHGLIDDVRIYDYALSQDEIGELFKSANYVTKESKYTPVDMEFKPPTTFQHWDRKEFAGAQKDVWHITKSGQVEAQALVLITNVPTNASVMTVTLPYNNASIVSVKRGDESLSFTKSGTAHGYDITIPSLETMDIEHREVNLIWTMPLDKLQKSSNGYRAELAGLIPVDRYKLSIVLDDGCGYVFSMDPSRSEFMAFYQDPEGETNKEPKSYFGSCGIPIELKNKQ